MLYTKTAPYSYVASTSRREKQVLLKSEWPENLRVPERFALKAMLQVNVENIFKYRLDHHPRRIPMPETYLAALREAGLSDEKVDEIKERDAIDTFYTIWDFVKWYSFNHYNEIKEGKIRFVDVPLICQDRIGKQSKIYFFYCKYCRLIYARFLRPNLGCPKCKKEHRAELQRIRRQTKKGIKLRFCENSNCEKILPRKYPNRKYCSETCRAAARRARKKNKI